MKKYKININNNEVIIYQKEDGSFIKPNVLGSKTKTSLKPSHEPIVVAKKKSNTNNIDFLLFIYCAKASKKERNGDIYGNVIEGLNNHPTVKSLKIMKECAKQVIKDKDITILDMFAGSGSTGVAIEQLNIETGSNHKCILIEREKEYLEIIKKRCCIEEI